MNATSRKPPGLPDPTVVALGDASIATYVFEPSHGAAGDVVLMQPWLGETGQPAFYRQIAALQPEHTRPVAAALDDVRTAVRIGWGAADPWIPVDQATRLQQLLPAGVPVTTLPDVGHLAPIEAHDSVSLLLNDWLAA